MDIGTVLGSTVIATIISGFVSYISSRRQSCLQHITGERKEWREKIREIASKLDGASYKDTLKILNELKVRINAYGNNEVTGSYFCDAHIWKIIIELEEGKPSKQVLEKAQKQLIEYLSLLLKFDWERSKTEIKGNIYEIVSVLVFFCNVVYFVVSFFVSNVNVGITKFQLGSLAGIYIFLLVLGNVLFINIVKLICNTVIKGKITDSPKEYSLIYLTACYIIWGVSIVALCVIYLSFMVNFLTLDQMSILLLTIMYLFGLLLQYFSQAFTVDKQYYYICAIDKIRIKYENTNSI